MAEIFRLPAVSPTMDTGTIVAWRVAVGAALASGEVLVEVATDKATVEAQVYDDGVLLARLVEEDAEVAVGAPIAVIGTAGEDVTALVAEARAELAASGSSAPAAAAAPAPPSPPEAAPKVSAPEVSPPKAPPSPKPVAVPKVDRAWQGQPLSSVFLDPAPELGDLPRQDGGVRASPMARRAALEQGVDLRTVQGSGRGGRIVHADLEGKSARAPAPAARPDTTVKLTPMRKVIAKRLLASHHEIPVFYLTAVYDVGAWPALREALKAIRPDDALSYNDLLVAAVGRALALSPAVNASWTDVGIVQHGRVDVGVAVALPEGLITPVVRGADRLGVLEIGSTTRALAAKARDGKLMPEEYQGATFTVSNLGMFDIEHFTAVINPPEAAILAAGSVSQVPVVQNGVVTVGWRMKVTMSCDHRVIDGAVGAAFLKLLRRFVEAPALLGL